MSALRALACAGAVATSLLLVNPAIAVADDGTGDDGGTETVESGVGDTGTGGDESGDAADGSTRPTSTIGNGRTGEPESEVAPSPPSEETSRPLSTGGTRPKSKVNGFVIPVLRIPTYEEFMTPGGVPPSAFFGTFEVPTLDQYFRALAQPEPEPEPTPGPQFRTRQREDVPPVIDTVGADNGGGGDGAASAPPVFTAPVVVFGPPPPAAPRPAPRANPAPAAPVPAGPAAVAGVRAPLIRGTLPPSKVTPADAVRPQSGGAATNNVQTGLPQSLRNPTVGQLAAVALPGVAGLMFLTFGGGVIGYRQANSTRFVRSDAARFLP